MNYDEITDTITLTSGRSFYAYGDNLSMHASTDDSLTYGSDGAVDASEFTARERREIADYMIAKWQAWAEMPGFVGDEHAIVPQWVPPGRAFRAFECACGSHWRLELADDLATMMSKGSPVAHREWIDRTVRSEFAKHVAEASAGQPQPVAP